MQMPPLGALRAFHTVAQSGSLTAAAAELSVSSSAVSHQIRNLEKFLDLPLMRRGSRQVQLTEDGLALAEGLAEGFSLITAAVGRVYSQANPLTLRVVLPPIFATGWLFPRIDQFHKLWPKVQISLVDSRRTTEVSGRDGIVIDWGSFADDSDSLAVRLSGEEEIFPVCAPGACPGPGLAGSSLLHREEVRGGWDWPTWPQFMTAVGLSDVGTRSGPVMTARLQISAALQGKGVILCNSTIARGNLATGRLIRPVPESMPTENGYWLKIRRTVHRRSEARTFVAWLKEEFERDYGLIA